MCLACLRICDQLQHYTWRDGIQFFFPNYYSFLEKCLPPDKWDKTCSGVQTEIALLDSWGAQKTGSAGAWEGGNMFVAFCLQTTTILVRLWKMWCVLAGTKQKESARFFLARTNLYQQKSTQICREKTNVAKWFPDLALTWLRSHDMLPTSICSSCLHSSSSESYSIEIGRRDSFLDSMN